MFLRDAVDISNLVLLQFTQIFPYWAVGVFIGSILSVFASDKICSMAGKLGKSKYGIVVVVPAALLGVISPVCMYGTIPLIVLFGRKGVPQYMLVTFMVSSILLNPNLLLISFALGTQIALIRLLVCLAAGMVAGVLVKLLYKDKKVFAFDGFETNNSCGTAKKKRFFNDIHKSVTITAPYFLFGILISALFDRYIPKNVIIDLFGKSRGLGVLFAASIGVPVYVCGGGTIPILKVWLGSGMSLGSAVAFMLTGPATKLTNLSAVKIILGLRNFIIYMAFSISFAVIAGYLIDILL